LIRKVFDARRDQSLAKIRVPLSHPWLIPSVKLFYSGPVINTEMLVMMLEKHGIAATQEFVEPDAPEDGDLNRLARVLVAEADHEWRSPEWLHKTEFILVV
jgi:hypothetical protein